MGADLLPGRHLATRLFQGMAVAGLEGHESGSISSPVVSVSGWRLHVPCS